MIYHLTLLMVLFTDFCPRVYDKYYLGWFFVLELTFFLGFNLVYILAPQVKFFFKILKKAWDRIKACYYYYFKEEVQPE